MIHADSPISNKISELFSITQELEQIYPGRKFTIDGHLVGSIGEVLVSNEYGLTLLPNSTKTHDAIDSEGRLIQIKCTQIDKISISSEPQYLIVIQISPNGEWQEIYNGPGEIIWNNAGKMQKNGQRQITLTKLHKIMKSIEESEKIQRGII